MTWLFSWTLAGMIDEVVLVGRCNLLCWHPRHGWWLEASQKGFTHFFSMVPQAFLATLTECSKGSLQITILRSSCISKEWHGSVVFTKYQFAIYVLALDVQLVKLLFMTAMSLMNNFCWSVKVWWSHCGMFYEVIVWLGLHGKLCTEVYDLYDVDFYRLKLVSI